MNFHERDFFISRLRAGYIPITVDRKRILIYQPTLEISLEANERMLKAYEQAKDEELFNDDDIIDLLIINDLWSNAKEHEYNEVLPKHIEYWKMELYKTILKSKSRENIRKYLSTAKEEYSNMASIRHMYDYLTCNGYATYVKNMFIISKCAKINGKRVNWHNIDLNKVMNTYYSNILDSSSLRLLSRTSPWVSIWSVLKLGGRIFKNDILTNEQQGIVSWSIMYDKIHECPDCPPDDVIEDDDMLDGWLLIQRKQREDERKKQEVQGVVSGKIGNADEIFIPAESKEDARKIDLLNDARGNKIKRQRLQQIKEQGIVKEQNLHDMKLRQSMQMQQEYARQLKGG